MNWFFGCEPERDMPKTGPVSLSLASGIFEKLEAKTMRTSESVLDQNRSTVLPPSMGGHLLAALGE